MTDVISSLQKWLAGNKDTAPDLVVKTSALSTHHGASHHPVLLRERVRGSPPTLGGCENTTIKSKSLQRRCGWTSRYNYFTEGSTLAWAQLAAAHALNTSLQLSTTHSLLQYSLSHCWLEIGGRVQPLRVQTGWVFPGVFID